MKLAKILTLTTFSVIAAAWKAQVAFEFDSLECNGKIGHAWIGANRQQIKMRNSTQSVYITTANDGIWRWYGFSESTEDGSSCYGDPVARLHSSCFDLRSYVPQGKPKVECIRICSMLAGKKSSWSCAAFGVTE
ncbi:hypothetical protein F4860DRAFT_511036 [Xylaria cubensis]|nr:hypothetical protein F4860DRAFT_511036 [Xylaria cubensis]